VTISSVGLIFGALALAAWGYRDFHYPYQLEFVQSRITLRRYVFGLTVYICGLLFFYIIIVQSYTLVTSYFTLFDQTSVNLQYLYSYGSLEYIFLNLFTSSNRITPGATVFGVFIVLAVGTIQFYPFSNVSTFFRNYVRSLSYFPTSYNSLCSDLGRANFASDADAVRRVNIELQEYQIGLKIAEFVPSLALPIRIAQDINSIRFRLRTLYLDNNSTNRLSHILIQAITDSGFDVAYHRFIQHLAESIYVEITIREKTLHDPAASSALFQIIDDEADMLRSKCFGIIAQAALSSIYSGKQRFAFLNKLGFGVSPEMALPFWPMVLSFMIVLVGMAVPQTLIYIVRPSLVVKAFDIKTTAGIVNLLAVLFVQSVTQSAGVAWAIVPKSEMLFARPTFRHLPVKSYLVFGLSSFITSATCFYVMYMANTKLPFAVAPKAAACILSLQALVYTLIISIRMDYRLRNRSASSVGDRVMDGLSMAAFAAITQCTIIILLKRFVFPFTGITAPTSWISEQLSSWDLQHIRGIIDISGFSEFTLIYAFVGFAIGYAVPGTAADSLLGARTVGEGQKSDGIRTFPVKPANLPPSVSLETYGIHRDQKKTNTDG